MMNDSNVLDSLNPTEVEQINEVESLPQPEIIPDSQPLDETYIEKDFVEPVEVTPEFTPFNADILTVPKFNSFVPADDRLPETDNDGSVFMAYMQRENTIGSLINRGSSRDVAEVDLNKFNPAEYLRPDQLPDLEYYVLDTNIEQIKDTEERLNRERKNQAILEEHPWQALWTGIYTSPLEFTNYMPGGAIFKQAKTLSQVGKAFVSPALATATAVSAQEVMLHNTQLTREFQESVWNVTASSILGGALGVGANRLGKAYQIDPKAEKIAYNQIMDTLIDPDQPMRERASLSAAATKRRDESLADIPELVRRTLLETTPGGRLAASRYKTANKFLNNVIQHNWITKGNLEGETGGASVETMKNELIRSTFSANIGYQDAYYKMLGIEKGVAKKARAAIAELNSDQLTPGEFADRVSQSLFMNAKDENPFVNEGAAALKPAFDRFQKELVELGRLSDVEGTKTSAGFLPIMKNKQLILEQGGRDARGEGTYPQAVFNFWKKTQEEGKIYSESPFYKEKQQEISLIQDDIKGYPEKLEKGITEGETKQVKSNIKESKKIEKALVDERDKINNNIEKIIDKSRKIAHKRTLDLQKEINKVESEIRSLKNYLFHSNLENEKEARRVKKWQKMSLNSTGKEQVKFANEAAKINANFQKEKMAQSAAKLKIADLKNQLPPLNDKLKLTEKEHSSFVFNLDKSPERLIKLINKYYDVEDIKLRNDILSSIERLEPLDKEIKDIRGKIFDLEKQHKSLDKSKVKNKTKDEVGKLEDRISEIKREIAKNAPKYTIDDEGNLFPFDLSDDVLWSHVEQHVDKVLGHQEDLLLNPFVQSFNRTNSLKERTLLVDQEALHPWHIKDPVKLLNSYARGLSPLIALEKKARELGFESFEDMRKSISNELHTEFVQRTQGMTGKQIAREDKKLKAIERDIIASIDIVKGIYENGFNVNSTGWSKFFENFRAYNALRMLGGITISSITDVGRIGMQNGVFNTIYHGLVPMLSDPSFRKISSRDIKAINYSIESELGLRVGMFVDQETLSTNPGFMTKSFSALSQAYGDLTLFNQWTSLTERAAGNLAINDTLSTIHKIVNGGKVTKRARTRLAQLGIDEMYFDYIASQTSKESNISSNGTRVADWTNWDVRDSFQADALRAYQHAIAKDIEVTLNYPGAADIPLVGHTVPGKLLLQFKSFMFSATNKTLVSGIQRRKDVETYTGVVSMLGLGALGYVLSSYSKGKEPDLELKNLAKESLDRSGVLGVLMEVIDIGDVLTGGTGVSRYQTRGALGAALGPTYGSAADLVLLANKFGQSARGNADITTKDIKSLTRLLPFQNIFYMNWLSDQLVTETGNTFNLIENREGY